MNNERLLSRSNNIAGGLVSRGVMLPGWPWSDVKQVPRDIVNLVEGRITNNEFEKKYSRNKMYEAKNLRVSESGEVFADWVEIDNKPPKYR